MGSIFGEPTLMPLETALSPLGMERSTPQQTDLTKYTQGMDLASAVYP